VIGFFHVTLDDPVGSFPGRSHFIFGGIFSGQCYLPKHPSTESERLRLNCFVVVYGCCCLFISSCFGPCFFSLLGQQIQMEIESLTVEDRIVMLDTKAWGADFNQDYCFDFESKGIRSFLCCCMGSGLVRPQDFRQIHLLMSSPRSC
jgi:hypothetical protein